MPLELTELRGGTVSRPYSGPSSRRNTGARSWRRGHADAIMDRIAHNAAWVDAGEANMSQHREIDHKSNKKGTGTNVGSGAHAK